MKSKISFMKSAVFQKDYPIHNLKEVAFMGRSNAGKSSLINNMTKQNIAKVSQTPGKTRLLNFFNFNDSYALVDMPGYGYASRSGDEMASWQAMIEEYLAERECLAGLVLVMDIRRKWTKEEAILVQFVQSCGRPVALALTKTDKITKAECDKFRMKHIKDSKLSAVFVISNTKKSGYEDLEEYIYRQWINDGDEEA